MTAWISCAELAHLTLSRRSRHLRGGTFEPTVIFFENELDPHPSAHRRTPLYCRRQLFLTWPCGSHTLRMTLRGHLMRLNARLPEELARKLEALERATGQGTSDVVRVALERYFTEICGTGRSAREAIYRSGL